MAKETLKTQESKTEKVNTKDAQKPKKNVLTKRAKSVISPVVTKPKKVVKEVNESKSISEKVIKPVTNRKINSKPVLAKTSGINISPAKVKNIISNFVLNKDSYSTLKELKSIMPRTIKKTVDGKEVVEEFKGTPVSELSKHSLDYIAYATEYFEKCQRDEYTKTRVAKMTKDVRETYLKTKNDEKNKFDKVEKENDKFLNDCDSFNAEEFNRRYDSQFYNDYDNSKKERNAADAANKTDEWKRAIDKVTKLKNRFSTNSRVFLSALVEYLIKQMATNGTVCCVADKKKIIQLSHILDTSKPGFAERFPLYPLIVNLDTFKQAQKYLQDQAAPAKKYGESVVVAEETADDSKDDENESDVDKVIKPDKNTDIFTLNGLTLDKQYQFRYYIGESCREVRMDLVAAVVEGDEKASEVYNYTSVSKIFKNFCSTLVCEFLMRIGQMLGKEIETRNIKTVNDIVIGTVISHYHIVCGVEEKATFDFIRNATSKYYSYVSNRQETRKNSKKEEEGDLAYETK